MNLYFDNATTSHPRSQGLAPALSEYLHVGGPYGRAAYGSALTVSRRVEEVRSLVASYIGAPRGAGILFTSGATESLDTVIFGFHYRHKRVLHGPMEHNSVMRPLHAMAKRSALQLHQMPSLPNGMVDLHPLQSFNPSDYDLAILNHASNVNGVAQPLAQVKEWLGETPLLVDASQSIGHLPIDMEAQGLDYVAFGGHKGLAGPTGIGILAMRKTSIEPLRYGGTGSFSESMVQPEAFPDRYEAGSGNWMGIYMLGAAIQHPLPQQHSPEDFAKLLADIEACGRYELYAPPLDAPHVELFSLLERGKPASQLAAQLYERRSIATRSGLHCAPLAHATLGTHPTGLCRISLSKCHTPEDIEILRQALVE